MCTCLKKANRHFAQHNCRIAVSFGLSGRGRLIKETPMLVTEKINARGKKPPIVIPAYCPFCGDKYPREEVASPPKRRSAA